MVEFVYGIIAGVAVSFAGYGIIEWVKSHNFNKKIKNLIKIELNVYSSFLEKLLREIDPKVSSIVRTNSKELREEASLLVGIDGHFNIFNYNTLSSETKAKAFDVETLTKLELTYQRIRRYGFTRETMYISTIKTKAEEYKIVIDETISKLD